MVYVVSPRDEDAVRVLFARRPDVDLVSVHSPPFLHALLTVGFALDAGHAVLCDKPFGRNVAGGGDDGSRWP